MNFKEQIEKYQQLVDQSLDQYLEKENDENDILYESMRYSVFAGGKRLRPILVLASYELFDQEFKEALPLAASFEMIHTYSLIHDDLPAMDNDDYRRGKLTNHKVYSESIAILAGDGLLNLAHEILLKEIIHSSDPVRTAKSSYILSEASGVKGMIGGQVVDILSEGKEISKNTLNYIHKNKTGALITAAMVSGALLAKASEDDLINVEKIGGNLGLAFQIKDDLLDITGDESKLGKKTGSDENCDKSTYPKLFGVEESQRKVEELTKEAKELLTNYLPKSQFLLDLCDYLIMRDH